MHSTQAMNIFGAWTGYGIIVKQPFHSKQQPAASGQKPAASSFLLNVCFFSLEIRGEELVTSLAQPTMQSSVRAIYRSSLVNICEVQVVLLLLGFVVVISIIGARASTVTH